MLFAPYKAILAEALAPAWTGTEEEKAVLREGLGLTPPGEDFWAPLGEATKFLHPEDRVRLLVDFTKAFKGGEEKRQALLEVKDVLEPVRAVSLSSSLFVAATGPRGEWFCVEEVPPSVAASSILCFARVGSTAGVEIVGLSRTRPSLVPKISSCPKMSDMEHERAGIGGRDSEGEEAAVEQTGRGAHDHRHHRHGLHVSLTHETIPAE